MHRPPRKPGTKIVNRPQVIRWFISGFVIAATALCVLAFGPGKPSTTHASVSMTMAFAIVSFSAVNVGLVLRRERQAPWSSPVFPFLGWIILGWILTWAAVELNMLQRLLDTTSLSGGQWGTVLLLSLIAPAVVGVDKAMQLRRQRAAGSGGLGMTVHADTAGQRATASRAWYASPADPVRRQHRLRPGRKPAAHHQGRARSTPG